MNMSTCSCRKKIGPLQWDLSVAEHLQPGEGYRAVRSTAATCSAHLPSRCCPAHH